jgi:ferredoxin--NADP+ reductase
MSTRFGSGCNRRRAEHLERSGFGRVDANAHLALLAFDRNDFARDLAIVDFLRELERLAARGAGDRERHLVGSVHAPCIFAAFFGLIAGCVSASRNFGLLLVSRGGVIEPLASMHGWSAGQLIARQDWAPGLATLAVDAAVEPFAPGQFVNLALEIGGLTERRSYSIASPPGKPLKFLITEVAGGKLTPALLALRIGDPVLVEPKPQGFFTLKWVPDAREVWLVATGTGLGPFLSLVASDELWQRFERVVLVHGVRDRTQLAHRDELLALTEQRAGRLALVSALSREPGTPELLHGRLTTLLSDGSLERAAKTTLDPARSHVMLCGNPAMIEEMTALLGERGLRKHRQRAPGHITVEKYW